MLEVQQEGNLLKIDVRAAFRAGQHPKEEILRIIRAADRELIIELHITHQGKPLIPTLEEMGKKCVVSELGPEHYCLTLTPA